MRSRCTGMIVTYADGVQEVLGQWFESVPGKDVTIREVDTTAGGSVLKKLRFVLSKDVCGDTAVRQITAVFPSYSVESGDLASGGEYVIKDVNYGVSSSALGKEYSGCSVI